MFRDQIKNYFYRMKITSPDGSQSAELTEDILRLVTSVNISESSYSDDSQTYPTLSLTLQETSYLPEDNSFNTTNANIRGQITNRPGSILDIRFDSEKGFTYVSKEELESGRTRNSRTQSNTDQPVVFLFGGNNKLEIEWGLLSPKTSRKRTFTITTLSMQGGGTGHGTVTITALDGMHLAEKITPSQGKVFANPTNGQPNTLKQVLFQVTRVLDYDLEFDGEPVNSFPPFTSTFVPLRTAKGGDTAPPDPKYPITLPRHMNLHDFVKSLANEYASAYEYDTDQKTGRTKLIFSPRNIKYGNPAATFTYKGTKGDVLSYKIDSVEGQFNPTTSTGAVTEGAAEVTTKVSEQVVLQDTGNTSPKVPAPLSSNVRSRVEEILGATALGKGETHPSKSESAIDNHNSNLYESNKYISVISLVVIGDPTYKPGLYKVNNIGLRYSTFYRMFTVQHTLNASGYICTFNGKSQFIGGEAGVDAGNSAKENKTEKVQLVQPN